MARQNPFVRLLSDSDPTTTTMSGGGHQSGTEAQVKDVYIAVMGVTGAGKSTFISLCSGKNAKIGHSLQSCTTEVEPFSFMFNPSVRVHLIDTPGFDDTNLSDVQVLQNIAHWLSRNFEDGIRLSGIIFMHRISDPRLSGSAKRNLLMFKKLCGEDAFKSVVLVTSMWDKVSTREGNAREKELIDEPTYWGSMCKRGSRVFRYQHHRSYALNIVEHIVSMHQPVTLDIQDEIVNKHCEIEQTSAASQLNTEIIEERKKHQAALDVMHEQMDEAISQRDEVLQQEFKQEIEALQASLSKGQDEQVKLRQTLEEIEQRKQAELEAFMEQTRRENEMEKIRHKRELAEYNKRIADQERELQDQQVMELARMTQQKADMADMDRRHMEHAQEMEKLRVEQEKHIREMKERYEREEQERREALERRNNRNLFEKWNDFMHDVFGPPRLSLL